MKKQKNMSIAEMDIETKRLAARVANTEAMVRFSCTVHLTSLTDAERLRVLAVRSLNPALSPGVRNKAAAELHRFVVGLKPFTTATRRVRAKLSAFTRGRKGGR